MFKINDIKFDISKLHVNVLKSSLLMSTSQNINLTFLKSNIPNETSFILSKCKKKLKEKLYDLFLWMEFKEFRRQFNFYILEKSFNSNLIIAAANIPSQKWNWLKFSILQMAMSLSWRFCTEKVIIWNPIKKFTLDATPTYHLSLKNGVLDCNNLSKTNINYQKN